MTDRFDLAMGVAFIVFVALMLVFGYLSATTRTACLRAGYPSFELDYTFTGYCIKRMDQTDVVVPVEQVRR